MLPFYSPISPQSPVFSQNRAMGQCIKIKNMHDFVLFIHKIVHKLAGVAGFEPTNDGVRVRCLTAWESESVALPLGDTPILIYQNIITDFFL